MYPILSRLWKVHDGRGKGERRHHRPEGVENSDRFESFLNKSKQGKSDQIRITAYTTEGDPIVYDVEYDGKTYQYSSDASRDQFGSTDDDRKNEVCQQLDKTIVKQEAIYTLSKCAEGTDHELLRLPKQ